MRRPSARLDSIINLHLCHLNPPEVQDDRTALHPALALATPRRYFCSTPRHASRVEQSDKHILSVFPQKEG